MKTGPGSRRTATRRSAVASLVRGGLAREANDRSDGQVIGSIRQVLPFALAASSVPLTALANGDVSDGRALALGLGVVSAMLPAVVVLMVRRVPAWVEWGVLAGTFAGLMLLVQGTGSVHSGGLIALVIPVVWMALYERPRQVGGALVLEAIAAFTLRRADTTAHLVREDVRLVTVFLAVSVLIAWATARLVGKLARSERAAQRGQATIAAIAGAARQIRESPDPRSSACEAVMNVSGAACVLLIESDGPEHLTITATAGVPFQAVQVSRAEPSASVLAFQTGEPVYIGDVDGDSRVNPRLVALTGARALLAQPFSHGGVVSGVVVATWSEPRPAAGAETIHTLEMLVDEFGSALERADLYEVLRRRATTDALTGMANRRVWRAELPEMMAGPEVLCIAVLDLDSFKDYNDTRGHLAGDRLLAALAKSWSSQLRPQDLLVRWGGEEFALALPGCDLPSALEVLERLRASVPDGQTVSAGLACWDGSETIEAMMSRADAALYRAKQTGRDRTVLAVEHTVPEELTRAVHADRPW